MVDPISISSAVPPGTQRPTNVAVACQLAAAVSCQNSRAVAGSTNSPAVCQTWTGRPAARASQASRMWATPSAFVSKQSHSSPVIVTASRSNGSNRPANARSASVSPAGSLQSGNGTDSAASNPSAALRFAPPTSNPRVRNEPRPSGSRH